MSKQSTIKSVMYLKEFSSRFGLLHSFTVTLENGDTGEINAKDKTPAWLQKGKPLLYEITTTKYGNKFKRLKEETGTLPINDSRIDALEKEVKQLKEVIRTLVMVNGLKYAQPKPAKTYTEQIVNAPDSPYDENRAPF